MSSLKASIADASTAAVRAKDRERVKALRLVNAALKQAEIDGRKPLEDADVLAVLTKMRKQRLDSLDQFTRAERDDLAAIERYELAVIDEFMPQMLSERRTRRGGPRRHRRHWREQHEGHGQGDGQAQGRVRRSGGHGGGKPRGSRGADGLSARPHRSPASGTSRYAPRNGFALSTDRGGVAGSHADSDGSPRDNPPAVGLCSPSMAGKIPQSFINALIERIDPAEVIGRRVELRQVGNRHTGLCPFHRRRRRPSTSSGRLPLLRLRRPRHQHRLLMERDGLTFPEAVESLAALAGMEVPRERGSGPKVDTSVYDLLEAAAARYGKWLDEPATGKQAQAYLRETRAGRRGPRALRRRLGA